MSIFQKSTAASIVVSVVLFGLVPSEADGQTSGRVVNADGEPMPHTQVEMWGRAEVLHITHTDQRGQFTLPELSVDRITRYVFRYLGFGVEIIQRDEFQDGQDVQLMEEPAFELEGIEATVSRDVCPQDDQVDARRLWESASSRYNRTTSRHGIGGRYEAEQREVNEHFLFYDLKGEIDTDLAMSKSWSSGDKVVEGQVRTLEEVAPYLGYAWDREIVGPEYYFGRDRHLNWVYAELDTRSASHSVTPTFASLHTFLILEENDSTVRLRFCSGQQDEERPYLRGTLLISEGGDFLEADWRFETDDPVEDAGGWVSFTTARDPSGGPPHLVADRSLFFRHNGFDKMYPDMPRWVFRDLRDWRSWVIASGPNMPSNH